MDAKKVTPAAEPRTRSARIKATFRFDPENLAALEQTRIRRIAAGVKRSAADISDLLNEAIREAQTRNISEVLFEKYLGITGRSAFDYEAPVAGSTKRPDYALKLDGQLARFEVKQFDPTPDDFQIGVGTFDPYPDLREKINAASKQFKGLKGTAACCLVLYNNGKPLVFLTPIPIYGAMLGNVGWTFPIGGTPDEGTQAFLGGGKMLHQRPKNAGPVTQNTTMSAIIALSALQLRSRLFRLERARRERELQRELSTQEALEFLDDFRARPEADAVILRARIYENPFAAVPLDRRFGCGPWDERFGLEGADLARVFVGPELAALEEQERAAGVKVRVWYW